jgi:hypothetical protein
MSLTTARRRDAASVQQSIDVANHHQVSRANGGDNRLHILRLLICGSSDGGRSVPPPLPRERLRG